MLHGRCRPVVRAHTSGHERGGFPVVEIEYSFASSLVWMLKIVNGGTIDHCWRCITVYSAWYGSHPLMLTVVRSALQNFTRNSFIVGMIRIYGLGSTTYFSINN